MHSSHWAIVESHAMIYLLSNFPLDQLDHHVCIYFLPLHTYLIPLCCVAALCSLHYADVATMTDVSISILICTELFPIGVIEHLGSTSILWLLSAEQMMIIMINNDNDVQATHVVNFYSFHRSFLCLDFV